jgi:hypothetical protein
MRAIKDADKAIEQALYYRDQCLEWAAIAATPTIAASMRKMAAVWDQQAKDMKRDVAAIADSHRLIAQASKVLRGS